MDSADQEVEEGLEDKVWHFVKGCPGGSVMACCGKELPLSYWKSHKEPWAICKECAEG